jgi:hypothetical protein
MSSSNQIFNKGTSKTDGIKKPQIHEFKICELAVI